MNSTDTKVIRPPRTPIFPFVVNLARTTITPKNAKRFLKRFLLLALPIVFFPKIMCFLFVAGFLDVIRNDKRCLQLISSYFLGNGVLTWLLSPLNLWMDLIALPYWNRGVYRLDDLPTEYQAELKALMATVEESDVIDELKTRVDGEDRAMVFFKWYGKNIQTSFDIPEFHKPYKYVRTIGVSVFNQQRSTSRHFGPLRVTLRMLYNINPIQDPGAFIEVGNRVNRWCDNRLFIFDDTLQHRSCNETEELRFCMFVDFLRPSLVPSVMSLIVDLLCFFLQRFNFVFYKYWKFIK